MTNSCEIFKSLEYSEKVKNTSIIFLLYPGPTNRKFIFRSSEWVMNSKITILYGCPEQGSALRPGSQSRDRFLDPGSTSENRNPGFFFIKSHLFFWIFLQNNF